MKKPQTIILLSLVLIVSASAVGVFILNNVKNADENEVYIAPIKDVYTIKQGERGNNYEIFADQVELNTFTDPGRVFEFSYPKQWGTVTVFDNDRSVKVGPFVLFLGEKGKFTEGDEIASFGMYGYYKKDGVFYSNRFKDSENGPYAFEKNYWDDLVEIPTQNGMALLHATRCNGMGCGRVVSINLNDEIYSGVGIRSDRGYEGYDPDPKSDTDVLAEAYDTVLDELKVFVKTFKDL